ncbi:MAG: type II toxin-antitoxin system RelE/ParE family toxin [Anaerolineales bacterium]|nr:type II toxin-antitoxin system RelE/ParE family toxin [Anaerolineales bacterium]
MASYRIVFKESVAKDLRQIPEKDIQRILKRIDSLQEDPRPAGVEKLSSDEKYRIRQGKYRILYMVEDETITVVIVKVGHRRDVYR